MDSFDCKWENIYRLYYQDDMDKIHLKSQDKEEDNNPTNRCRGSKMVDQERGRHPADCPARYSLFGSGNLLDDFLAWLQQTAECIQTKKFNCSHFWDGDVVLRFSLLSFFSPFSLRLFFFLYFDLRIFFLCEFFLGFFFFFNFLVRGMEERVIDIYFIFVT